MTISSICAPAKSLSFESEEIERLQAGSGAPARPDCLVDHRLELYAVPLDDKTKS